MEVQHRVRAAEDALAVEEVEAAIASMEKVTLEPGFWDDQENAKKIMAQISRHQEDLQMVKDWKGILDDVSVALELHAEEDSVCPLMPHAASL